MQYVLFLGAPSTSRCLLVAGELKILGPRKLFPFMVSLRVGG